MQPRTLIGGLAAAFAALVCVAAAPASATVSTTFATSTELVRPDPDRGWAIKLRLAAAFEDSDGIDAQPVLERLTFRLPEATVNAGGVKTCSARPRIYVAFNDNVCADAGSKPVGIGTSDVQLRRPKNINLFGNPPFETYHLRLGMFIGPAVKGGRILMVIGNGINTPLTMQMRGLLTHTASGWTYSALVPTVRDPDFGITKVQNFAMTVGGWTAARPRRWFIEAPRTCPATGFLYAFTAQFEGVAALNETRRIGCELVGT